MKKTTFAFACAAILLLTGASIWEGSAVVASSGELPDSGYYVATNSFPKNTIVDIKNLETDKTIRAIVAGGLDSPGLLASLSSDAAAAIGLNRRTVGRIRVTMPADPIAFSRFTDGLTESADPDRNPKAAAGESENASAPTATPDATPEAKPAIVAPVIAQTVAPEPVAVPVAAATTAPSTTPMPSTQEVKQPVERSIDVPENYQAPAPVQKEENQKPESTVLADLPESTEPTVDLVEPKSTVEAIPETTLPPSVPETANAPVIVEPAPTPETIVAVEPTTVPKVPLEAKADEIIQEPEPVVIPETVKENIETAKADDVPVSTGEVVLDLLAAEERPPKAAETDLTNAPFVAPIAEAAVTPAMEEKKPELAAELFLDPLPAPKTIETPKKPVSTPTQEISAKEALSTEYFSAPNIKGLDKGKYYVQLGAFTETDTVKEALARIGKKFPAVVQTAAGKAGKNVYRVIVGPVNQGESGALLVRFKRTGYPDAFVKKGI
ncbi:MAG: SPOR domain-containing protein [Treponemataceae bacterium]